MPKSNRMILLKGMKIYAEDQIINSGYLIINDTLIYQYGDVRELRKNSIEFLAVIDMKTSYSLVPGFIDLHIHGAGGADTMDATKEALETMAKILPKEGTTSFLATTMTQSEALIEAALSNVADYLNQHQPQGIAEVLGIHLEGPFVNTKRAGAQPLQYIVKPNIEKFKQWNKLANAHIKQVTLAPECHGGLALVELLHAQGIIASIGHSDASFSEVELAVEKGASQVTHLYNQMSPMHHREPGVVGAALLLDQLKAEIIVDGIHSRPEMVKLCFKQKGKEGMILITDAMRAKGLGDGTYDLGGQVVTVQDRKASLADGTLAGSVLTMGQAVKNMLHYTGCSLEDIVKMASMNPAQQVKVFNRKGSIAVGKDADLVILDNNYDVVMTICRGKIAYHRGE